MPRRPTTATDLGKEFVRPLAVHVDAPSVADDLGDLEAQRLRFPVETAHIVLVVYEKSEMKALWVSLASGLLALQYQHETIAVRKDRDRRRPAIRLKLESKRFFEKRDCPWDVSDLKVEMIEFHGEPFWARESALGRGTSPRSGMKRMIKSLQNWK
jgi:hypothetical protein